MKRFLALAGVVTLSLTVAFMAGGCQKVEKPKAPAGSAGSAATPTAATATPATSPAAETAKDADYVAPGTAAALAQGIDYLKKAQLDDGGWPGTDPKKSDVGVSAVVLYGLLTADVSGTDPTVEKGITYLLSFMKEDGSVFAEGLQNYTTSISIMVLRAADPVKYKDKIDKMISFLRSFQWTEGEGIGPESADFGGAGYGKEKRPDLSNTAWFVEAIRKAGYGPDDPAVKKALIFVSRTQSGEEAKGYWVALPDGGFIYTPHGGGDSKAGKVTLPSGQQGLKSYGSMTYAGFLSMIFAGVDHQDKRVQAALEWVQKHWTLEENPEMGSEGHFYYLMTMGKALKAYGSPTIVDDKGTAHPWRKELSAKLVAMQQKDGSWVNAKAARWYEGNPTISTPFVLIALSACEAKL